MASGLTSCWNQFKIELLITIQFCKANKTETSRIYKSKICASDAIYAARHCALNMHHTVVKNRNKSNICSKFLKTKKYQILYEDFKMP